MRPTAQLAAIVAGYVLAALAGVAAVVVNEWMTPQEVSLASGGMVAFGDMILFVVVAGIVSLVPTWFLLRLAVARAPRLALGLLILAAALGPVCWLLLATPNLGSSTGFRIDAVQVLGWVVAFIAIPRVVAGPVLIALEVAALVLFKTAVARGLLMLAMLMDVVPLLLFLRHLMAASRL